MLIQILSRFLCFGDCFEALNFHPGAQFRNIIKPGDILLVYTVFSADIAVDRFYILLVADVEAVFPHRTVSIIDIQLLKTDFAVFVL